MMDDGFDKYIAPEIRKTVDTKQKSVETRLFLFDVIKMNQIYIG